MRIFLFLILINSLFGLPRFSVEEATTCANCHVNPTGSGMRNDYGTNVYTFDELTLRKWIVEGDDEWDGFLTDQIQIGGEFRIQAFNGNGTYQGEEGISKLQGVTYSSN